MYLCNLYINQHINFQPLQTELRKHFTDILQEKLRALHKEAQELHVREDQTKSWHTSASLPRQTMQHLLPTLFMNIWLGNTMTFLDLCFLQISFKFWNTVSFLQVISTHEHQVMFYYRVDLPFTYFYILRYLNTSYWMIWWYIYEWLHSN